MRRSLPFLLVALGCGRTKSPASAPPTVDVAGSYEAAFERSAFTPCGSNETWWVDFDTVSNLDRTVFPRLAMLDGRPDSLLGHAVTFARFRGDTTRTGRYGHLGQY